MTSENFEKYIALLKGLLKLGKVQQEEIAVELQDHLEHRTEQLTREGKSVEEAEMIAIKEFGDAAGMASSFINISRIKRRRWMMRFTTFAIAGSFLIALFVMSMWPQNGPVRMASSNAQDNSGQDNSSKKAAQGPQVQKSKTRVVPIDSKVSVSKVRSNAEQFAIQALDEIVAEFEVMELPMREAIELLSNNANVPIIVSKRYLEDNGVDQESPVTLNISDAKLTTILDMILSDQLGLTDWTYGVKDSVVFVSSEDNMDNLMEVRVYDCSDFAVTATVKVPVFPSYGGLGGGGLGGGGMGGGGGFFFIPSSQFGGQGFVGGGGGRGGKVQESPNPAIVEGGSKQVKTEEKTTKPATDNGGAMALGYKTYKTQDLDEVIECIQMTVDGTSWDIQGGLATLNQVGSALVIKQSIENHQKIDELLMMLRKAKR